MRSDDVACAVADQVEGGHGCLLRPSGYVGRDQTEESDKWRWRSLGEVVAKQTTNVVMKWQADDQKHAQNGNPEAGSRDQEAVAESVTQISTSEKSNNLNCSARSTVEEGFFCSVAKGRDELREEV